MTAKTASTKDLSAAIADALRQEIEDGRLAQGDRLPSEADLARAHNVSRPTVREALKRLAAQSLIRTKRGAQGGAFVNAVSFHEAVTRDASTVRLLISLNSVDFEAASAARFQLEQACVALAASNRQPGHLARMRDEIARQRDPGLSHEEFCASDVAFHRALVEASGNPILSYHLSVAVESMLPLMNMITFTARSRAEIVALHEGIADGLENGEAAKVERHLADLAAYTNTLARDIIASRDRRRDG